jgi:prepilin-type N-terminal cleavage/methylation domain-containing protein
MKDKFTLENYGLIQNKREEEGFTLLEVIIALTLTGVILFMLSPALFNIEHLLFRENEGAEVSRVQRLISRKMEEILGNAYLYPFYDGRLDSFSGDAWGFSLPTVTEKGLGQTEVRIDGEQLFIKWESFHTNHNSEEVTEEPEIIMLTAQLNESSFSYLDEKTGTWISSWYEDYYPRLVQFNSALIQAEGAECKLVPIILPLKVGQVYGD